MAGNSYELGTSSAVYQFSSQGSFSAGDTVTLLLGMNGEVVSAVTALESSGVYYGVVTSSEQTAATSSTTASDTTSVQVVTTVACTDGVERTFYHDGSAQRTGRVVSVSTGQDGTTIKSLRERTSAAGERRRDLLRGLCVCRRRGDPGRG